MSETQEFLKDVKNESQILQDDTFKDLLDKPKVEAPKAEEAKAEESEEKKPRRYRRLEQKNKEMEQMLVEMNERIKSLSEADKFAKENDLDPLEVKVLGTDENGKLIKSYLDKRFEEVREKTRAEVLAEIENEKKAEAEALAKDKEKVDSIWEDLEERYGVNLTNPKTKAEKDFNNGLVDIMEKMSPKDSEGNIVEYADPDAVFEVYSKTYQAKPRETSDRQKSLASRSMTEGGRAIPEAPKGPITFKTVGRYLDGLRG